LITMDEQVIDGMIQELKDSVSDEASLSYVNQIEEYIKSLRKEVDKLETELSTIEDELYGGNVKFKKSRWDDEAY
jgi:wobble nucleotide-excising tRNase